MTEWTKEQQAEHRKLWVEALRSGKYPQSTAGKLKSDDGFCCLGVACELSSLGTFTQKFTPHYSIGGASVHPRLVPEEVADFYGINIKNLWWLASANDSGTPFVEIAKLIEGDPEDFVV